MPDKNLTIKSILAQRNGQPYVQITLDGKDAQFNPEQARSVAAQLMAAASAAESDAAIHRFIGRMDVGPQATMAALQQFRKVRQESQQNPARQQWDEVE